jgi:hypothetical protein
LVLMLVILVWRVLYQQGVVSAQMGNLSPLMAFAFVGAILFPKPLPWWAWAALLLVVDWFSMGAQWWASAHGRVEVLFAYGVYAVAAWWGGRLRGKAGIVDTLLGTLTCSVVFYLVTNSVSWWVEPYYAKNGAGWVQALTVGLQGMGYPTTLEFFRNSLVADLLGAAVLLTVYHAEAVVRKLRFMPLVGWGRGVHGVPAGA